MRAASGAGGKTPTDYFLRATADAPAPAPMPMLMAMTTFADLSGPSGIGSTEFDPATIDAIIAAAKASAIKSYDWKERGIAPFSYTQGMAVAFGQLYRRLLAGDVYASEMAKPEGPASRDALAWYRDQFAVLGLADESTPADVLRRLFCLMVGLGMRESSGRHCTGRDQSAHNVTADTAEAGLFQTSWNARSASPLIPLLFQKYAGRTDLIDLFAVKCKAHDLENHGGGDGAAFQKLSKACPAFAIEVAAVGLRNIRKHWGPITNRHAEVRPECDLLFRQVQAIVDQAILDRAFIPAAVA